MTDLKLNAKWKPDCQGKQDYDGTIIGISTRYYSDFHAYSMLILCHKDEDYKVLDKAEFSGETESDVKRKVEVWAQKRMDQVVTVLSRHFTFSDA